jgi:tetrameric-type glycyl-tRNA synthetase beta subunit
VPSLLLEIGCEELPASACREAEEQLPGLAARLYGKEPDGLFVTPRRLAVLLQDLPADSPDEWVKGPPEAMRDQAAAGFARKHGLKPKELEERDGHLWARIPGKPLREVAAERARELVRDLTFSKSMRWNGDGMRFARPVRWTCLLLDDEALDGNRSYGRRFAHGEVEIPHADGYAETLRAAGVEPDAAERRRLIVAGLDALGDWSDPAGKLDEVVYMVEQPTVLEGRFDERLLSLPEVVIETAMQEHQRYFPLGGARFAFVAGGGDPAVVRTGNERVLENRLEDAAFTFERDVKRGIDELAKDIGAITFAAGAGSFADKTERLVRLVDALGGGEASREAARLAKADQAAELVREFPDLEGTIGAEYARLAGYPEAVAAAIEEQYLPDAAGGALPQTEAGRLLAAADRIDNLTVAFALGRRPTGSRDPFGLRRAAIGLNRLAIEAGLRVDIPELVSIDERLLAEQGAELKAQESVAAEVADFVEERLEGVLSVPVEFVRAARGSLLNELGRVAELAETLAKLDSDRLERLHTVFTRADRIVAKSPDQDLGPFRQELLVEPAEQALFQAQDQTQAALESAASLDEAIAAAEQLAEPLERFFDEVLVMAEDKELRRNRLRQLYDVRDLLEGALGDLNQISV